MKTIAQSVNRKTQNILVKSVVLAKLKTFLVKTLASSGRGTRVALGENGLLVIETKNHYTAQELRMKANEIKNLSAAIKKIRILLKG